MSLATTPPAHRIMPPRISTEPKPPFHDIHVMELQLPSIIDGTALMLSAIDRVEKLAQPIGKDHIKLHRKEFESMLRTHRLSIKLIANLVHVVEMTLETFKGWW